MRIGQEARCAAEARELGEGRLHLGARSAAAGRQIFALLHRERHPPERAMHRRSGGERPARPVRRQQPEPIVCQTELGGSIDADAFRDADGKLYLYFKNDGNRVHAPHVVMGRSRSRPTACRSPASRSSWSRTTRGGRSASSKRRRWSARPPAMSCSSPAGSSAGTPRRAGFRPMPWAMRAVPGPLGPCKAARENPILHSFNDRDAGCLSGPGHQSIFTVGERSVHQLSRLAGEQRLPQARRPPLSLYRADLLEGRQAPDRPEPALARHHRFRRAGPGNELGVGGHLLRRLTIANSHPVEQVGDPRLVRGIGDGLRLAQG